MRDDLKGRVALVTGANSGLGLETSRALAARGARVLMACRSAEKAHAAIDEVKKTARADVEFVRLDLGDLAEDVEIVRRARFRLRGIRHPPAPDPRPLPGPSRLHG